MMSRFITIFLAILSGCGATYAQSIDDGRIEGNTYINSYFHFSLTLPKQLKPRDPRALNVRGTTSTKEFLIFSAQEADRPFGIVMLAERTAPNGIRDGNDFLGRVIRGWSSDAPGKVLKRESITGPNGLKFEVLDYVQANEWNSAITMQIGEYLIAVRCNASSQDDLAPMRAAVLASRSTATVR